MPNDCSNSLYISKVTTDQWQKLADSFQVRGEGYQQDFLKTFFPEPDWQNTPNEKGHLPGPSYMGARGYRHRTFGFGHTPALGPKTAIAEPPAFPDGTIDQRWRPWRVNNWGTKWDVYDCCNNFQLEEPSDDFGANFCTAWGPLSDKCMEVLSKQFPGAVLTNSYDECGMDFCGVTVAKDGEVLGYWTEISTLKETWAMENHPGLWEEAENPENDHAVDELDDLWFAATGEVVYDHLDAKEEILIERVLRWTSPVEVG